jgi:hypothetical protein
MKKERHCRIAEISTALFLGTVAFQLTSCGRTSATAVEPKPPDVEVVTVEQRDVPIYREWIGTLDGLVNAAIRSEVTGYLLTQNYSEGSFRQKRSTAFPNRSAPIASGGGSGAGTARPRERPASTSSGTISAI